MSQSTREWLLAKYVKAATACADMGKTISEIERENVCLTTAVAEWQAKAHRAESELAKYVGQGEVQERLETMSVCGHVRVTLHEEGCVPRNLAIRSLHTSNGTTYIHVE